MDLLQFNSQVLFFSQVLQEFGDFESIWNQKYLKIYFFKDIEWETRFVFSFAFNSPVFYFKPRTRVLGLEQVLELTYKSQEFVSQAEFPESGEPFFFLHPCRSSALLEELDFSGWISVVLQVIGVYLPLEVYERVGKKGK